MSDKINWTVWLPIDKDTRRRAVAFAPGCIIFVAKNYVCMRSPQGNAIHRYHDVSFTRTDLQKLVESAIDGAESSHPPDMLHMLMDETGSLHKVTREELVEWLLSRMDWS